MTRSFFQTTNTMQRQFSDIRRKFVARLLFPVAAVALVMVLGGVAVYGASEIRQVQQDMEAAAHQQANGIIELLAVTDALAMQRVQGGMQLLQEKAAAAGTPSLGGMMKVRDMELPTLKFGDNTQTGNYDIVDATARAVGGTQTLFARVEDNYVRVSTNITVASERAIGTLLDRAGPAYEAITRGQNFYGVADILGEPFLTAYEPMIDPKGSVVGIWYVGYKIDQQPFKNIIAQYKPASGGIVSILDANGTPRFFPQHMSKEAVTSIAQGVEPGWKVIRKTYDRWRFDVMVAYPEREIYRAVRARAVNALLFCIVAYIIGLALLMRTLRRHVLKPLGGEPNLLARHAWSIAGGRLEDDIIADRNDHESMLAALRATQDKLRTMSASIHENAADVAGLMREVDEAAQAYRANPGDDTFIMLVSKLKILQRAADMLQASIAYALPGSGEQKSDTYVYQGGASLWGTPQPPVPPASD